MNHEESIAARAAGKVIMSADDILGDVDSLKAVPVPCPEWKEGSLAYVAELSANERDALETGWVDYKQAKGEDDNVGFRAWCIAFCLCDTRRVRLFNNPDACEDAANKIAKRNAKAASRLFNCISRINGLTKADIDELEGNSDATLPENADGSGESHSG